MDTPQNNTLDSVYRNTTVKTSFDRKNLIFENEVNCIDIELEKVKIESFVGHATLILGSILVVD